MDLKKLGLGLGAFAVGAAAWTFGTGRYGDRAVRFLRAAMAEGDARPAPAAGHVPTDLIAAAPVTIRTRAPAAFRPDPTAIPTAEEREALRPATGPAPTLVADRGTGFSDAAGAA